jgi:predicted NBD/HSP70 family sugar kinase
MAWLGLDIGGTRVKAVLWSDGSQRAAGSSRTYNRPDSVILIRSLSAAVQAVRDSEIQIEGVGFCIPGVRSDDGSSIVYAANVPGLEGIFFADLLNQVGLVDVPYLTISDAMAASHDAREALSLHGRVAYLSIGAGVGLAVVEDGKPIEHTDGGAGHVGQLDVSLNDNPPIGPDGGRGCLEGYIGAAALRTRFGDNDQAILEGLQSDCEPLIALARAIRIVHVMYRPDSIVLLGGLGHRLQVTDIDKLVNHQLSSLAKPGTDIRFGIDDYHAARGAARLASLSNALSR